MGNLDHVVHQRRVVDGPLTRPEGIGVPMRISGPVTVSALMVAGLVASGSAAYTAPHTASQPKLAAATNSSVAPGADSTADLVPAAPEPPRKLTAMPASSDGLPL